jgi:hypothetical protein
MSEQLIQRRYRRRANPVEAEIGGQRPRRTAEAGAQRRDLALARVHRGVHGVQRAEHRIAGSRGIPSLRQLIVLAGQTVTE